MQIKTKDADEAAFIWTLDGFNFDKIEKVDGFRKKIINFIFSTDFSEDKVNSILNDYRNGKTLVEPKKYAWKRAEIKEIIKENIFS